MLSEIEITAAPLDQPEQVQPAKIASVTADHSQKDYEVEKSIDGQVETGWGIEAGEKTHQNRTAIFRLEQPVSHAQGTKWTVRLKQQHGSQHTAGRFRLSL